MKNKIYLIRLIFFFTALFSFGNLNCQTLFGKVLHVKDGIPKNLLLPLDSIKEIVFNGSNIKSLNSEWKKFTNVKKVTFLNGAIIPTGLNNISNVCEIEVRKTDRVVFPNDFPFSAFNRVVFYFVSYIPDNIHKFINAECIKIHASNDDKLIEKIEKLKGLKTIQLSDIPDVKNEFWCAFPNLESLSLTMLNINSQTLNLNCLKKLKIVDINFLDIEAFSSESDKIEYINLHYTKINSVEALRLKELYKNITIYIW